VIVPAFDLRVALRATEVTTRTPSDARIEGVAVELARSEASNGLPTRAQPGERYVNITLEHRVFGKLAES
jgi:hypothetical protein